MKAVLLAVLLASCSHSPKIYADSWQPEERDGPMGAGVVYAALLVKDNVDIDVMNRAGATLIGWHDARNRWAARAASTGGTHFAPVKSPPPAIRSDCYAWGDTPLCSAGPKARDWSRVAVFRLTPDRWHVLPPHLIPTDGDVINPPAAAVRAGCQPVSTNYGIVRCNRGWHLVTNAAVAANVEPIDVGPSLPGVTQPRGPTTTEPIEPDIDLEGAPPDR